MIRSAQSAREPGCVGALAASRSPGGSAPRWASIATAALLVILFASCTTPVAEPGQSMRAPSVDSSPGGTFNESLLAAVGRDPTEELPGAAEYRIGPGDLIQITVFQVEELNRTVRVRPDGAISLPLLGHIEVAGATSRELEDRLAARLGKDYLQDPQVSVPVAVLVQVNEPGIYYLRQNRSLLEVLSEAGGLTEEAGHTVHLRRRSWNEETGEAGYQLIVVDLDELMKDGGLDSDFTLRDHDAVQVPKAGFVFVEGAVKKPGAYPLENGATVLKAVTMAGGVDFKARKSAVRVIRAGGGSEIAKVDLGAIPNNPSADLSVRDGDVVIVPSSAVKVALTGLWRGVAGLVNLSAGF
jgi:polysaccharide export outer membrane protein